MHWFFVTWSTAIASYVAALQSIQRNNEGLFLPIGVRPSLGYGDRVRRHSFPAERARGIHWLKASLGSTQRRCLPGERAPGRGYHSILERNGAFIRGLAESSVSMADGPKETRFSQHILIKEGFSVWANALPTTFKELDLRKTGFVEHDCSR